jgi:sugar phosphate isomerase/epimerase
MSSRRHFIQSAGTALLALHAGKVDAMAQLFARRVEVDAHLWVYASRFPPDWDCTPILDEAFSEISYAGFSGIEIMEPILRHADSVERLLGLSHKYSLPVSGSSYYGDMWNRDEHQKIIDDISIVAERLHKAGGTMMGLTVGDAKRKKTEEELDAQAEIIKKILKICERNAIHPNMHNHTFEMEDGMRDFKGTIERVPELKLGPDLNWLIRAKVDPVWFIKTYGKRMVYMHLRDQYANGKWTERLGEGSTDFKAIAKALKDINYDRKAAVELAFESTPVHPVRESWKLSREYVHTIFGW